MQAVWAGLRGGAERFIPICPVIHLTLQWRHEYILFVSVFLADVLKVSNCALGGRSAALFEISTLNSVSTFDSSVVLRFACGMRRCPPTLHITWHSPSVLLDQTLYRKPNPGCCVEYLSFLLRFFFMSFGFVSVHLALLPWGWHEREAYATETGYRQVLRLAFDGCRPTTRVLFPAFRVSFNWK